MLKILAPAKINLTLEVLGRRPDGFHELKSVVQTVSLHDEVYLEESEETIISSDSNEWDSQKSLVSTAVNLLREATGANRGVTIKIVKNIPLVSGMGGDSSDAAAVLRGLNEIWNVGFSFNQLYKIAEQLGSDVPLFLYGGTLLIEGRGEKVTTLPPVSFFRAMIVMPSVSRSPGKTARLYASLDTNHYTDGTITLRMVESIKKGQPLSPELLFNTFENVVFNPSHELAKYQRHLQKLGLSHVHLTGSGPAMFALLNDRVEDGITRQIEVSGMKTFIVQPVYRDDIMNV